jgi:hypothetical protein
MSATDWTLISGDATAHATLKSASYCNIKGTEFDAGLNIRAQSVTARMQRWLSGATWVANATPPADLVEACLMQVTYEHKQRETPGLTSVSFKDGSINKNELKDGWLPKVHDVLSRYRRHVLIETDLQQ